MDTKLLYDALYTDKCKIINGNVYYNGKIISAVDWYSLIRNPIVTYSKCLKENANGYQKGVKKDSEVVVFMVALLSMYERIYSKYENTGIFREEKGRIIDCLDEIKDVLGTEYNTFFIRALLRKGEETKKSYKEIGFENVNIEKFGMLFETFYNKPDNIKNEDVFKNNRQQLCSILSLCGSKGVLKYLLDNNYTTKEECKEIFSDNTDVLWELYYYGVRLDSENETKYIKPLKKEEREDSLLEYFELKDLMGLYNKRKITVNQLLELSNFLNTQDFIYLYKKGDINLRQLSKYVDFFGLANSTYNWYYGSENEQVVREGIHKSDFDEDEEIQTILEESYLSEDELMRILNSTEYRKKVDNNTTDVIWSAYLSHLISLENLKKLENMKTYTPFRYLNISKIISQYQDYKKHLILEELEINEQDRIGLENYFTFEKIVEKINKVDKNPEEYEEKLDFFNTVIRKIYEEKGIDFEEEIIQEQINQSETNEVNNKIINLYDKGIISSENLFKNSISTDELLAYYIEKRKQAEKYESEEDKAKSLEKANKIIFTLSENGSVDLIDLIDVLQKISLDYDKSEDEYIDDIYKMVGKKELSPNIIYEFFKEDKKENATMQILEKFDEGLLDSESVKRLSVLFDYSLIQDLYDQGKIEYEDLKEIVDEEKAKEIDEKYDIYGKLEELKKKGGIKGIEVEHVSTGKKRVNRGGRKNDHNIDDDTKALFYYELANLDKEDGMEEEDSMLIEIDAPVFKGFVLYAMPNFGIGFMEGDDGSTFTVRLKEVLEEADRAYSTKNIIGSSKSRRGFALDNPDIVRKNYHCSNWAKKNVESAYELATKNSDIFRKVIDRRLKTDNKRILNMRKMIVDIKEEYSKNLKKKKDR